MVAFAPSLFSSLEGVSALNVSWVLRRTLRSACHLVVAPLRLVVRGLGLVGPILLTAKGSDLRVAGLLAIASHRPLKPEITIAWRGFLTLTIHLEGA